MEIEDVKYKKKGKRSTRFKVVLTIFIILLVVLVIYARIIGFHLEQLFKSDRLKPSHDKPAFAGELFSGQVKCSRAVGTSCDKRRA